MTLSGCLGIKITQLVKISPGPQTIIWLLTGPPKVVIFSIHDYTKKKKNLYTFGFRLRIKKEFDGLEFLEYYTNISSTTLYRFRRGYVPTGIENFPPSVLFNSCTICTGNFEGRGANFDGSFLLKYISHESETHTCCWQHNCLSVIWILGILRS